MSSAVCRAVAGGLPPSSMSSGAFLRIGAVCALLPLPGCVAVSAVSTVAGTAVEVTATAAGAAADLGAAAVAVPAEAISGDGEMPEEGP